MSHRIVYDVMAIGFPVAILNAVFPDRPRFQGDQYILLELGGDNNMWSCGQHPRRSRSWDALAYGDDWRTMREVVGFSESCEGGGMRLYGKSHTYPESYIRYVRNAMKKAVAYTHPRVLNFDIQIRLELNSDVISGSHIDELDSCLRCYEDNGKKCWGIGFGNIKNMAMLFLHGKSVDKRTAWQTIRVSGPC